MKILDFKYLLAGFSLVVGCSQSVMDSSGNAELKVHDAVIGVGEEVIFKNPNGSGKIRYVSEFARQYEIEGKSYDVKLVQRAEEFRNQNGYIILLSPGEFFARMIQPLLVLLWRSPRWNFRRWRSVRNF